MKRATAGDLVGSIEFAGTVIPLKRFKVSPSAPAQKTVSVSVLKAEGGKRLEHLFPFRRTLSLRPVGLKVSYYLPYPFRMRVISCSTRLSMVSCAASSTLSSTFSFAIRTPKKGEPVEIGDDLYTITKVHPEAGEIVLYLEGLTEE